MNTVDPDQTIWKKSGFNRCEKKTLNNELKQFGSELASLSKACSSALLGKHGKTNLCGNRLKI